MPERTRKGTPTAPAGISLERIQQIDAMFYESLFDEDSAECDAPDGQRPERPKRRVVTPQDTRRRRDERAKSDHEQQEAERLYREKPPSLESRLTELLSCIEHFEMSPDLRFQKSVRPIQSKSTLPGVTDEEWAAYIRWWREYSDGDNGGASQLDIEEWMQTAFPGIPAQHINEAQASAVDQGLARWADGGVMQLVWRGRQFLDRNEKSPERAKNGVYETTQLNVLITALTNERSSIRQVIESIQRGHRHVEALFESPASIQALGEAIAKRMPRLAAISPDYLDNALRNVKQDLSVELRASLQHDFTLDDLGAAITDAVEKELAAIRSQQESSARRSEPDQKGYVESPIDPAAYKPAWKVLNDHTPKKLVLTAKRQTVILENFSDHRIRWTRPEDKAGKPIENRRNVHLGDWISFCDKWAETDGEGFPRLSDSEVNTRKEAVRQSRQLRH